MKVDHAKPPNKATYIHHGPLSFGDLMDRTVPFAIFCFITAFAFAVGFMFSYILFRWGLWLITIYAHWGIALIALIIWYYMSIYLVVSCNAAFDSKQVVDWYIGQMFIPWFLVAHVISFSWASWVLQYAGYAEY